MYSKSLAPETALKQVGTQKRTKREKTKGLILGRKRRRKDAEDRLPLQMLPLQDLPQEHHHLSRKTDQLVKLG
jgi:hypothetical protein